MTEQEGLVALEIECIDAALADTTPVTITVEPGPFEVPDGWVVLAAIGPMLPCKKCGGRGSLDGEPCPRCEEHPCVDPESYEGCLCGEEHGPGFEPGTDGKTAVIRL